MQPFVSRRNRLQKNLATSDAFLIQQPSLIVRSNDTHYPFHPSRHFYYLTGFDEPNAWLLITKDKTYLWSEPQSEKNTLWNGNVVAENAVDELLVDHWNSILDISTLNKQLKDVENLFVIGHLSKDISFSGKIHDGTPPIDHMRIIKDGFEIDVMTESCHISAIAHNHMISQAKYCKHETELLGHFIQAIASQGTSTLAYEPIVASGKNALTLHYIRNNQPLKAKELILVDAGCEYQGYAADISRTFPANGIFTKEQQALYEACLDVQEATIDRVCAGITLNELQEFSALKLTEHLIQLKLINTSLETAISEQLFRQFFPHRIGHTLGLDVHDIPAIDGTLQAGMVITIEPGIYVNTPGKYQNIGIRIEDDILVTESGYKNLTREAVKSVKDIQLLMQS